MITNPAYQRIAELEVMGVVQREIADLLGIHHRTVEKVLVRPEVKEEVERLRDIGVIDLEAQVAVRRALLAVDARGNPDHRTRMSAAKLLAEMPRTLPAAATSGPISIEVHLCQCSGNPEVYDAPPHATHETEDGTRRVLSSLQP